MTKVCVTEVILCVDWSVIDACHRGTLNTHYVRKTDHQLIAVTYFIKSERIFKILSLLERVLNFQENLCNISHHSSSMLLLHYVGELTSSSSK